MFYTDSIPAIKEVNFNKYEKVLVGVSINVTVEYSPNVLTSKWYRYHAPLPPGNDIINYSVSGKNYSSLIFSNVTLDDYGLYTFVATSYCGYTSSVNEFLDVTPGEICYILHDFV